MTNIANNVAAKLFGAFVAVTMIVSLATPAQAATVAELEAMIASLTAQLSALAGGSSSTAACTFTRSLTDGVSGSDVTCLQNYLIGAGFTIPAGATGYFGAQTTAAVAAWQAANGVSPAVGYFGPVSQAKFAMVAGGSTGSTGTPSTGSSDLSGSFGSISDMDLLGQYNNEEVGEGEDEVRVYGFDLEAEDEGDIRLSAMTLKFNTSSNTGSNRLNKYVDKVEVWMGDDQVASIDVDDFSENSNVYTKTVALDGAIVRADDTERFYITVDAASNIDSSDISGDATTIEVDSIRVVDGSGVTTTDSTTGDIGTTRAMDFVNFSTSADTELKIRTASDNPEAGIVIIDDGTSDTDDVVLLKGRLELDGDSDVVIDEFPVTFTPTGAEIGQLTGSIKLVLDGEEFTESVSSTATTATTLTFDDLDFTLEAGDTIDFVVMADINGEDSTGVDNGDTLKASVTASNRDLMDVENEEGDQLSDSTEKSGTATGEAQEFRVSGINLELVSTNETSTGADNNNTGTFTIKYKVTAIGDTVYVSSLSDAQLSGLTDGKTTVHVDRAGTATVGGVSVVLVNNTDNDLNAAGLYEIEEGESHTFTLTTSVSLPSAGADGQYRAVLGGVEWTTTSTATSALNAYTSNLDEFETDYISLI